MLAGLVILSVTIWVCSRNLVKAVEAQGNQVHEQGQELRLQLAAVNRVLLDGLKPDWWVKLTQSMKELDEASNASWPKIPERSLKDLVALQSAFVDEVSKIPLLAVDPYLWAMVQEAGKEFGKVISFTVLLGKKDSVSGDEGAKNEWAQDVKLALQECKEFADEAFKKALDTYGSGDEANEAYFRTLRTRLESLRPRVGQHDLIWWFRTNLQGLSWQRSLLQRELEESVKMATAQPKQRT
jgi:hypothetical protein